MESAGYYDLLKFGILGLLDALIPKISLCRVGFFIPYDSGSGGSRGGGGGAWGHGLHGPPLDPPVVKTLVTVRFHLDTITKISKPAAAAVRAAVGSLTSVSALCPQADVRVRGARPLLLLTILCTVALGQGKTGANRRPHPARLPSRPACGLLVGGEKLSRAEGGYDRGGGYWEPCGEGGSGWVYPGLVSVGCYR